MDALDYLRDEKDWKNWEYENAGVLNGNVSPDPDEFPCYVFVWGHNDFGVPERHAIFLYKSHIEYMLGQINDVI